MKKYREVPQWWYLSLYVISLAVGIGCSYSTDFVLMPAWSIILFSVISAFLSIFLGFSASTCSSSSYTLTVTL